jgi:hypothetical protein
LTLRFSWPLPVATTDLRDPPLVLGDDPRAAFVGDAEERALELARDPLQVLRPVLHARGVVRSGR